MNQFRKILVLMTTLLATNIAIAQNKQYKKDTLIIRHSVPVIDSLGNITAQEQKNVEKIQIPSSPADSNNPIWRKIIKNEDLDNVNQAINLVVTLNDSLSVKEYANNDKKGDISKMVQSNKLPVTSEDLLNFKKVKSIQGDSFLGVFIYDYFSCKFIKQNDKIYFQKTSGSQRKSGYLYKRDEFSYVFLGGWTVNDEPLTSYNSEHAVAGILYKISQNKLIIIFANLYCYEIYDIIK